MVQWFHIIIRMLPSYSLGVQLFYSFLSSIHSPPYSINTFPFLKQIPDGRFHSNCRCSPFSPTLKPPQIIIMLNIRIYVQIANANAMIIT